MMKTPLTLLFAILLALPAYAGSYLKTQADYIMASPEEQREYVVKVMELIVSIESQYRYEVSRHGYDQKRFEKYSSLLRKLGSEIFFPSAHAAGITGNLDREFQRQREMKAHIITIPQNTVIPPSQKDSVKFGAPQASTSKNSCGDKGYAKKFSMGSWESFAKAFNDTRKAKSDYCIFAGWISRTSMVNGEAICNHPDYISGAGADRNQKCGLPLETLNYPDPDLKDPDCVTKNGKRTIQCNPAIFGYKNSSRKSLFCVEASEGAHNSALSCMRKALADPAVPGADSKEKRLKFLQEKLKDPKNKALFEGVQEFVYQTCICDSPKDKFSKGYHDYIKDHRTCYGMMKMMADTFSCEVENRPLKDNSIFESLIKYSSNLQTVSEDKIDAGYKIFRRSVRLESSSEYKRLCGDEGPNNKCESATCTESDGKHSCKISLLDKDGKSSSQEISFSSLPKTADGKLIIEKYSVACPLSASNSDDGEKEQTTCSAECKPSEKAPEGGKKSFSCDIKVDYAKPEGKDKPAPLSLKEDFTLEDKATKLTLIKDKAKTDKDLECSVTYPEEPAGEYECRKAVCSPDNSDKDNKKYSCQLTLGKKGQDATIEKTYNKDEKPEGSFKASLPIEGNETEVVCSDITTNDDDNDSSFDFKFDRKCADKSCTVELKPLENKTTEGWTVEWSLKDAPKAIKEGWKDVKPAKDPKAEIAGGTDPDQQFDSQSETAPKPTGTLKITQPRIAKTYSVCAKVTQESKTASKCETIPAVNESVKPAATGPLRGPTGPGIMPPPVMIRPMSTQIYDGVK